MNVEGEGIEMLAESYVYVAGLIFLSYCLTFVLIVVIHPC